MDNQEIWKDIPEYEGIYQVSNLGRVKSLSRNRKNWVSKFSTLKERILKQQILNGYYHVRLCIDKQYKTCLVHRLVATAFLENIENKPQVNHKNGVKTDNKVSNLEWVTKSENQNHAYATGLQSYFGGENRWNSKMTDEKVLEIRQKYATNNYTYKQLADEYNVKTVCIFKIVKRKTWKHI